MIFTVSPANPQPAHPSHMALLSTQTPRPEQPHLPREVMSWTVFLFACLSSFELDSQQLQETHAMVRNLFDLGDLFLFFLSQQMVNYSLVL